MGYVGLRTLEAGVIAVGVLPLMAVVSLRQNLLGSASTDTGTLVTIFAWEVTLAIWLITKGFIAPANTSESTRPAMNEVPNWQTGAVAASESGSLAAGRER